MKRVLFALLALAAAFAVTPAAMADSYTYTITGSNFSATLTLYTAPGANGAVAAGTQTINWVSGTITDPTSTYNFGMLPTETANPGSNVSAPTLSASGGYLFDNLLYPGASGNSILDWYGLLVNDAGIEINIFSGASGLGGPGDLYFYFADANHFANNQIPSTFSATTPAPATVTLTSNSVFAPVPEPGTLFLLGTGLLGLAFLVFRKASKTPLLPQLTA